MYKKLFGFSIIILFQACVAFNAEIKHFQNLDKNIVHLVYSSSEFSFTAHVVKIPLQAVDLKFIPALGQREEVSSIAKRSNAFIAINGANYRRGGRYNGNRINLCYTNNHIITDLGFKRGSFGWSNKAKSAVIDVMHLRAAVTIDNHEYFVDYVNQPRDLGQSVLYTESVDTIALLHHTPGINVVIDDQGTIVDITKNVLHTIKPGWYVYQIDENNALYANLHVGMRVQVNFALQASQCKLNFKDFDFVLGGFGLLIHNREIVADFLSKELCQKNPIVHCNDEVAADLYTQEMQEYLIDKKHPRTVIGITENDELCIVIIDGRQENSEGLSLYETALFMKQLGCTDALNISGGGCSTLYIDGNVINNPSAGAERPVSEALCFFIKK